jgi:hypothetical protein
MKKCHDINEIRTLEAKLKAAPPDKVAPIVKKLIRKKDEFINSDH